MQRPYLDIAGSPIEVEVAALDIAVVRKLVNHLLFGGFLVYVGHNYDPAFHSCRGIQARISSCCFHERQSFMACLHFAARAPLSSASASVRDSNLPVLTPSDAGPLPRGSKPRPLRLTFGSVKHAKRERISELRRGQKSRSQGKDVPSSISTSSTTREDGPSSILTSIDDIAEVPACDYDSR